MAVPAASHRLDDALLQVLTVVASTGEAHSLPDVAVQHRLAIVVAMHAYLAAWFLTIHADVKSPGPRIATSVIARFHRVVSKWFPP